MIQRIRDSLYREGQLIRDTGESVILSASINPSADRYFECAAGKVFSCAGAVMVLVSGRQP